jgi:hypothetical protein
MAINGLTVLMSFVLVGQYGAEHGPGTARSLEAQFDNITREWVQETCDGIKDLTKSIDRLDVTIEGIKLEETKLFQLLQEAPVIASLARVVLPDRIDRLKDVMTQHHRETMGKLIDIEYKIDDLDASVRQIRYHQLIEEENQLGKNLLRIHKQLRDRPPTTPAELVEYQRNFHDQLIDADTLLDARPRDVPFAMSLNVASIILHQMLCVELRMRSKTTTALDYDYYYERARELHKLIDENKACSRFMSLNTARSEYDKAAAELSRTAESVKLDFLLSPETSFPLYVKLVGGENARDVRRSYLVVVDVYHKSDPFTAYYVVRRPYAPNFKGIQMYQKFDLDDLVKVDGDAAPAPVSRDFGRFAGSKENHLKEAVDTFNKAARHAHAASINYALVRAYNEWESASVGSMTSLEASLSKSRSSAKSTR